MVEKLGHSKINSGANKWDRKCPLLSLYVVQSIFWADHPFSSASAFPLSMKGLYGLLKVMTRKYSDCWNPTSLGVGQGNLKLVIHYSSLSFRSPLPHLQRWECKDKWSLDWKLPGCICRLAELGSISQWKGVHFWQVWGIIIVNFEIIKTSLVPMDWLISNYLILCVAMLALTCIW